MSTEPKKYVTRATADFITETVKMALTDIVNRWGERTLALAPKLAAEKDLAACHALLKAETDVATAEMEALQATAHQLLEAATL